MDFVVKVKLWKESGTFFESLHIIVQIYLTEVGWIGKKILTWRIEI